jgi:hypothetical protein
LEWPNVHPAVVVTTAGLPEIALVIGFINIYHEAEVTEVPRNKLVHATMVNHIVAIHRDRPPIDAPLKMDVLDRLQ